MAEKRTQLETVIQTAIDTILKEVHTCLPAVVTRVNSSTQLIDAQIVIKRKMGGELVPLPLLTDVPIRYFKTKTFSITAPIEIGDHVEIVFAERSIDAWLLQGGIKNPADVRKFSLSDAFARPYMYPQTDLIPDFNATDLEIKTNSGDTKIIVKKSEDVEIVTTGEIKADCKTLVADAEDSAEINTKELTATASTKVDIISPVTTIQGALIVTNGITFGGDMVATDVGGKITADEMDVGDSLKINGKELKAHTHPVTTAPGTTGPNN